MLHIFLMLRMGEKKAPHIVWGDSWYVMLQRAKDSNKLRKHTKGRKFLSLVVTAKDWANHLTLLCIIQQTQNIACMFISSQIHARTSSRSCLCQHFLANVQRFVEFLSVITWFVVLFTRFIRMNEKPGSDSEMPKFELTAFSHTFSRVRNLFGIEFESCNPWQTRRNLKNIPRSGATRLSCTQKNQTYRFGSEL